MEQSTVEVDQEALGHLESRLREAGTRKVAVVSVMGAFRTGKSFLLDLFLRFLRHEEGSPDRPLAEAQRCPPRGEGLEARLPAWLTGSGECLEGLAGSSGFRFRGGMDACTEGIWVWSEPFRRTINGEPVALLLMDTQGAWDSSMTREQSATIFGLTAVLSSRLIYNINMQIQEDKVENLAYFMRFAQAALHRAAVEFEGSGSGFSEEELQRPFQALDFLVRDWRHFCEGWDVQRCMEQMLEHFRKHLDPQHVRESGTAQALHSMFDTIQGFCLPHPGHAIEREAWTGNVQDISPEFAWFVDAYARRALSGGLDAKRIFGAPLTTVTFVPVLRNFVQAFHDAAPAAMSFTEAMTNATVLLAKEQAMKSYMRLMDEAAARFPQGLEAEAFEAEHRLAEQQVLAEFQRAMIFGSGSTREEASGSLQKTLDALHQRYAEQNALRLTRALNPLAGIVALGLVLFGFDCVTDWTCDWWLQACVDFSRLLSAGYLAIGAYVAMQCVKTNRRGLLSRAILLELGMETVRLLLVAVDLTSKLNWGELVASFKRTRSRIGDAASAVQPEETAVKKEN